MVMNRISDDEKNAIELLRNININPNEGLPEELFLLVSGLVPLPNVDLLIVNDKKQILLSRRNDGYFEKSWHIPGGCLRFNESFEERIRKTALAELGSIVYFDSEPIAVRNVIRGNNFGQRHYRERGHNVAILYKCYLPKGFEINNGVKTEDDNGYLKWFTKLPDNFMRIQMVYKEYLKCWM